LTPFRKEEIHAKERNRKIEGDKDVWNMVAAVELVLNFGRLMSSGHLRIASSDLMCLMAKEFMSWSRAFFVKAELVPFPQKTRGFGTYEDCFLLDTDAVSACIS